MPAIFDNATIFIPDFTRHVMPKCLNEYQVRLRAFQPLRPIPSISSRQYRAQCRAETCLSPETRRQNEYNKNYFFIIHFLFLLQINLLGCRLRPLILQHRLFLELSSFQPSLKRFLFCRLLSRKH